MFSGSSFQIDLPQQLAHTTACFAADIEQDAETQGFAEHDQATID